MLFYNFDDGRPFRLPGSFNVETLIPILFPDGLNDANVLFLVINFQEIMLVPWNIMKCIGLGWCLIIMTHLRRGKLQNRNSLRMETEHDENDGKSYWQLHRWVYCCIFVQNCRCVIFAGSCVTSKKMRIV